MAPAFSWAYTSPKLAFQGREGRLWRRAMVEAALIVFFILIAPAIFALVAGVAAATIGMVFNVEPRDAVRGASGFAARFSVSRRRTSNLEKRLRQLEVYEGQLKRELQGLPGDHPNRPLVEGYVEQVRILQCATLEEMHHATMKRIDGGLKRMLGEGERPEEASRKRSRRLL
jgi:hypothetical protein